MGKEYWAGILFFVVVFAMWGLLAEESGENAVDKTSKQIEKDINFPEPYSGINSSEKLAVAKIKKGMLLVKEGKRNIGTGVMQSSRASAFTGEGLKEIEDRLKMLESLENKQFDCLFFLNIEHLEKRYL